MRRFLLILVLLVAPRICFAGAFCADIGCDTLSTNPLRLLDRLVFIDVCSCRFGGFCSAELDPYSYQGSPAVPILGGIGSAALSCSVDSLAGTATFAATPCVLNSGWYFNDGIGVIVDQPDACFEVHLHEANGYQETNLICFANPCSSATATRPETWGEVKATYR